MKKNISLTGLILTFFLLSGCSLRTEEIIEITFIHGWGSVEQDHEKMRQIYQDFEIHNPDIRINMVSMPTGEEVVRRTQDMLMVGIIPDIIFLGGKGRDSVYPYMIENNYAIDLIPYFHQDKVFSSHLSPSNLEYWRTEEGGLYTVSDVLMLGGGYWYNRKIFKEAGIHSLPETWDDFEEVCKKIDDWSRGEENGVRPLNLSAEGYMYLTDQILASRGTDILEDKINLCEDSFFEVIEILKDLHNYSSGGMGNYTYRDETDLFNEGKLAIYVNGVWGAAMIEDHLDAAYALFPGEGKTICCESAGTGYLLGNTGDEKRQEASLRFLKYMLSEEVQNRILKETQQVTANPKIRMEDVQEDMPRFYQAVQTAREAEIKIEIPTQLWSDYQIEVFSEYIYDVLEGNFNQQTFFNLLGKHP